MMADQNCLHSCIFFEKKSGWVVDCLWCRVCVCELDTVVPTLRGIFSPSDQTNYPVKL